MFFLLAMALFITIIVIAKGIKIVKPNQRGVVTRLGKYQSTVDSGLTIINPFFDKMTIIDLLEEGIVMDKIDPIKKTGIVQVGKNKWSAITKNEEPISVNSRIRILDVEGMNLVVEKK